MLDYLLCRKFCDIVIYLCFYSDLIIKESTILHQIMQLRYKYQSKVNKNQL